MESFREQLRTAYKTLRAYAYHTFEDLTSEEANWCPANTKARTIQSYVRHLVNTEIYWLRALEETHFHYLPREAPFKAIIDSYKALEAHYLDLLKAAALDDLTIIPTKYGKDDQVQKRGTLAWTLLRVALHAFGHISHINHIRYSLGRSLPSGESLWW
ncbi:MAG: DinB family protein, partial [Candidatus Hodarchaeota archaeon]